MENEEGDVRQCLFHRVELALFGLSLLKNEMAQCSRATGDRHWNPTEVSPSLFLGKSTKLQEGMIFLTVAVKVASSYLSVLTPR